MRRIGIKYLVFGILGLVSLAYYILYTIYYIPKASAQTQTCGTSSQNARATGLVSTPDLISGSRFYIDPSLGACVVNSQAAFVPRYSSYGDLKSLYYDQSKAQKVQINGNANQGQLTSSVNQRLGTVSVVWVTGNLEINGNIAGPDKPKMVFVDGNLNMNHRELIDNDNSSGMVFVVEGNVNIDQSVTRIDAVLITQGIIYTAGAECSTSSVSTASALTINGSLISLNQDPNVSVPIKFCRRLSDNTQPAEIIVHQPKYLVILRNLLSDTLQNWSEIP